jgi:hypothetical protein
MLRQKPQAICPNPPAHTWLNTQGTIEECLRYRITKPILDSVGQLIEPCSDKKSCPWKNGIRKHDIDAQDDIRKEHRFRQYDNGLYVGKRLVPYHNPKLER